MKTIEYKELIEILNIKQYEYELLERNSDFYENEVLENHYTRYFIYNNIKVVIEKGYFDFYYILNDKENIKDIALEISEEMHNDAGGL